MELGSGQQQHSQSETPSSPARFQPASSGQPQQPPQSSSSSSSSSSSPFRFGAPDSRASYSERRLMNHSSSVRSTTAHNHPLGNGHQQQQHQHQSWGSGSHHTSSEGRSFNNAGLTALSRSNGSLAPSDKDASSSKPRSRTQVRKIIRSSSFQSPKRLDFASFLSLSLHCVARGRKLDKCNGIWGDWFPSYSIRPLNRLRSMKPVECFPSCGLSSGPLSSVCECVRVREKEPLHTKKEKERINQNNEHRESPSAQNWGFQFSISSLVTIEKADAHASFLFFLSFPLSFLSHSLPFSHTVDASCCVVCPPSRVRSVRARVCVRVFLTGRFVAVLVSTSFTFVFFLC